MELPEDRTDITGPAARYELACRAAGIGVWELHVREDRLVYSDIARSIFGFPADGPVTRPMVHGTIHRDDLSVVLSAACRAMDPSVRSDETYVYRIKRHDTGELRWLRAHGIAQFDDESRDASAVLYAGSVQDITDQELTRQALAASEERLRLAIDAAGMAVWDLDLEAGVVAQSPELNKMLGFPETAHPTIDELRSRYAPGERERLEEEGAAARARGESSIQTRVRYIVPGKGEVIYILRATLSKTTLLEPTSQRVIGVLFDATDQARAEQQLQTVNRELGHRLKNMVHLAGSFARQIWKDDPRLNAYLGRVRALTLSTDLMFGERKKNLSLRDLVERTIAPFFAENCNSFEVQGRDLDLPENLFTGVALVIHELATNAQKHGALSLAVGRVHLHWTVDGDLLKITWRETNGPPVQQFNKPGFGMTLLSKGALPPPHSVDISFMPEGVVALITVKLSERKQ